MRGRRESAFTTMWQIRKLSQRDKASCPKPLSWLDSSLAVDSHASHSVLTHSS